MQEMLVRQCKQMPAASKDKRDLSTGEERELVIVRRQITVLDALISYVEYPPVSQLKRSVCMNAFYLG